MSRIENGSTESTKLDSQTTATPVINLSFDNNNSLHVTWQPHPYGFKYFAKNA